MNVLDKLQRRFGRFAVPNVTIGLIACQAMVFVATLASTKPDVEGAQENRLGQRLQLVPEQVLAGEVWRLATFVIVPPFGNIVGLLFGWYLFYLMGTALEVYWGAFRYNVYLLIGYLATVGVSFLVPDQPASNAYLMGSVFLAFAFLNPDFELYIMFLVPVKIKWLALLTWIGYAWTMIFGGWLGRLLVLASVCNFLLFFAGDIVQRIRSGQRRMARQAAQFGLKPPPYFHRCVVCGITDRTHPQMDFRYCSQCNGTCGYCQDHLRNHEHVNAGEVEKPRP
jgi:hypothetical protein